MTSLTRTLTARSPGGIAGGRPPPASFDASLAAMIGSFWMNGTTTPRPTTSAGSEIACGGSDDCGQSITRMSSAAISAPTSRSDAATTTFLVGIGAEPFGRFCT